ncbi:DUF3857 domain-containing protein [Bacteroides sp. 519]|uniref:DUF3857 domain-containing protein n=1 Tax=Bacteroides sp. 519 TaxID=2302937 RepID=UPI0013D79665|nr:DUF3857 domain-containing protein [Bacteroides sp. 519]NDV58146.1 DUF3857 domain-containing protein [Bacteroides sp. 519]
MNMNNKVQFAFLFLFLLVCGNLSVSANENYNKAWAAFLQNNRIEAREHFNLALNSDECKADSYLGLAFLDWSESRLEDAFNQFQEFYKHASEPDAYLYGLYTTPFTFASNDVLEKEKINFLEAIINNPMHGTLKAMLNETAAKHYMGCNNTTKANELFAKTGALLKWQVLGTFNNVSGSGFDKDWGALQKSRIKDNFQNKVGATVNWYNPGLNKPDGWFDFTYYFVPDNVIAYAQTFVTSPEAQEVYLRAGTSGSLKIWINDALVASVKKERNCDMDIYSYKVKLNKGANRILLQVGQSEVNALNFLVRLTNANGDPVSGLLENAEYTKYTTSTVAESNNLLPFFAEEYLLAKLKSDSDNPIHTLTLAETYLRNDKAEEAILLLREFQKKAPKSSFVHYRLAEAYARAQNQTYYTKQMEDLKTDDPESFYALDNLCDEAIASNKITEVKNICQKMKQLYGENLTTSQIDAWLANKQNKQEDYIAIVKGNYEKYPYKYGYMNAMFNIEEYTLKNSKAATAIIEEYCSNYFNASALNMLSGRYIKDGDTEKGLQVLKDRIERIPYGVGFMQNYARTLYNMQRYEEALNITKRIIQISPSLADVYTQQAEIYKAMNNEKQAIEAYKMSIHYDPSSFESRAQLRQLEGKKEMEDLFPRYNIDSLVAKTPSHTDFPDDHSIIVLHDTKLMYYQEGAAEYHVEIAVKILNQTGVEIWKEYSIPYYGNQSLTLDKAEIIKENGQKVKAETNNSHVVFTNLEIGNVLYLEYRVKDFSTDAFSKHFYNQETFQYVVPSMITSYSILAPKDKKFQYVVANGKITPQISNIEDMKLYRWVLTDQPAVRTEPLMSSFVDVVPTLSFSSIPNWTFVSSWYKDLTTNKFKDDYLVKETLNEILKGNENASQLEKAKLFYEYILKNITYSNVPFMQNNFIPQDASRTISTRLGDCKDVSTLFVTFCRLSGIEANLVLILTRDNGRNILPLPSNGFNHCIAQLKVDGKTYYLELTDNKLPFGATHSFDLQSPILPIPYGNESTSDKLLVMDMPFRSLNTTKRETSMHFNETDVITKTTTTRSGASASGIRHMYADLGAEEQLKQLTQNIASDYTTPIKVRNLVFDDLTSLKGTAVYSFEIEAKNMVQAIAGMKIFKIQWNDQIPSLEEFSLESRKYPLELWQYFMEDICEETITITLPEGRKMLEIPEDVLLECANAVYSLRYDLSTPNTLRVHRKLVLKTEIVTPQEYDSFKNFMHALSEADNKSYGI